jgi:hypothetical protein
VAQIGSSALLFALGCSSYCVVAGVIAILSLRPITGAKLEQFREQARRETAL